MTGALVNCALYLVLIGVFGSLNVEAESLCPQRTGSDPTNINGRIQKLKGKRKYTATDNVNNYRYEIYICKEVAGDQTAVRQYIKNKDGKTIKDMVSLGEFTNAQIRGGVDWFMITYPKGRKYKSHCGGEARKANVMVTCDPDADVGNIKIIEEYNTNATTRDKDDECYYLFELNNKAACTVKPKTLSPGSIILIVIVIVTSVYILLGFLYQRYVVGAKGLEQIPNYNFWRDLGNLQADGCNFICRCTEVKRQPRYKPMDDAIADDEDDKTGDDHMLPM